MGEEALLPAPAWAVIANGHRPGARVRDDFTVLMLRGRAEVWRLLSLSVAATDGSVMITGRGKFIYIHAREKKFSSGGNLCGIINCAKK